MAQIETLPFTESKSAAFMSHLWPLLRWAVALRILVVLVAGYFGSRAGVGYQHMYTLGNEWIESAAILGTPIICMGLVLCVRNYWITLPICVALVLAVSYTAQPYLDWAHGPIFPWHTNPGM